MDIKAVLLEAGEKGGVNFAIRTSQGGVNEIDTEETLAMIAWARRQLDWLEQYVLRARH